MRRFHIYIGFIVWLLTSLFAVSCTDELEGNGYTPNSSSNLHVLVPTVLCASGSSSKVPTYNATVNECQINDLCLYAFPVDGKGKLVAENLPAPLATMMTNEGIATYQLNITPGKYHIYVVANMNKVLSDQTIQTEDALKNKVLDYRPTSTTGMPVCTNIPMIYEPEKDASDKLAETEIKAAGDKYTVVAANLKFTCVKVKLNLIFDSSNPEVASNFGGKSFSINSISADKLSPLPISIGAVNSRLLLGLIMQIIKHTRMVFQILLMTLSHLMLQKYIIPVGLTTDYCQQQITKMIS